MAKILAAVIISITMSSAAAAQMATVQRNPAPHLRNALEFAPNRDVLFADATRIAVRASLPAQADSRLSQQELMSMLLLTSLQNVPRDRTR